MMTKIATLVIVVIISSIISPAYQNVEKGLGKEYTEEEITMRLLDSNNLHSTRCGSNWREDYTQKVQEMTISSDANYHVAIPNLSGMSDRLIGLTTACMIAILTNRVFHIGRRSNLPILETSFNAPFINWSREADEEWLIKPLEPFADVRNYNHSVLEFKHYYAVNTIADRELLDSLLQHNLNDIMGGEATKTTLIAINRGKTIQMFQNSNHKDKLQEMGLTPATTFGCILNYLIKPKPHIFNLVPNIFEIMTDNDKSVLKIGLQIRTGDSFIMNQDHHVDLSIYNAFFSCAKQIENFAINQSKGQYKSAIWYLVSDSVPLRMSAVEMFGTSKIVTSLDSVVEHSSKESGFCFLEECNVSSIGFQTAAAEWWLLSLANYHVISERSGYGRSAGMLSLHPNSIYTIPRHMQHGEITCNNESFTDIGKLPLDWSGI